MEIVTLKNGTSEAKPLVAITMLSLRNLFEEKPIAAYEFVMLCRDPSHTLCGDTTDDLVGLLEDDRSVHNSVRNIVLSAVTGDGLEMSLGNPVDIK